MDAFHRPPPYVIAMVAALPPPHGTRTRPTAPVVRSSPSTLRVTFTGRVRPRLATNVAPLGESGSCHVAETTTGGTWSTWTWNELEVWLPAASEAVQVTVVSPTANVVPLAGRQLTVGSSSTTSVAV